MAELPSGTVEDTCDKVLEKPGGVILFIVDTGNVEVDQQTAQKVRETVVADHVNVPALETTEEQVCKSAIAGNTEAVKITIDISTDTVKVAKEVCKTAITLGALYVGYKLLRPVIDAVVKKALGGERDDQEVKDIKPGSLHVPIHCSTDERFLEVLTNYESGKMKERFQEEFLRVGFRVEEVNVEIENKAEVNKKKEGIEKRSRIKRNLCEDVKNPAMGDAENDMKKDMISKARSLALQFMSENPSCIRAVPYESEDAKSLTMCLYMDTNGKRIPDEIEIAAKKMFKDYKVEFDDLLRRPLNKIVTHLPSTEKQKAKELADLTRTIEKNLHLFENRMNVTAVQASYKVTDATEKNIPCVRVYVLGKGKIPAGETDIKEIKEDNSDIFNQTEFDVAEGYHKLTTEPSLGGYAWPLKAGVGIGVEGVHGVGTLGGFLEDEEANVYILSNEHVLHPPEAGDQNVIVQPSELDYTYRKNNAENILTDYTEETKRFCEKEKVKKEIKSLEENLTKIKEEGPREVGSYVCGGFKNNFTVVDGSKIYVDAAIASLSDEELSDIKRFKNGERKANRCPLYGFKTETYWEKESYKPPNGEIIDLKKFKKRIRTEDSELRFVKIGRTTGFTDEGFVDLPNEQMFLNCIFRHSTDSSRMLDVKFFFCKECKESVSSGSEINLDPDKEQDKSNLCKKCGNDLEKLDPWFWACNCFPVRKRGECFSKEGDSGALVFDQDGLAWGLLFGVLKDMSRDFTFSLISPLCVVLDALKRESGKKELKLWCTRDEATVEMPMSE